MTISSVIDRKGGDVVTVEGHAPVRDAVAQLASNRIGALPVVRDEKVIGILSERDIVSCLHREGAGVLGWAVERIMTAPAITVTEDVPVLSALSQMSAKKIRHLPVLRGGRLVGIVSIGDLVAHRIAKIESEADAMRTYIQSA